MGLVGLGAVTGGEVGGVIRMVIVDVLGMVSRQVEMWVVKAASVVRDCRLEPQRGQSVM